MTTIISLGTSILRMLSPLQGLNDKIDKLQRSVCVVQDSVNDVKAEQHRQGEVLDQILAAVQQPNPVGVTSRIVLGEQEPQ